MSVELIIAIIVTVVGASTPILIAAMGELVVEKSGVLNLGVEGMMLVGAITAFVVLFTTGNHYLAILVAAAAGVATSLIFGFLTLSLSANQTATGLALTIFGTGFSALAGQGYSARPVTLLGPRRRLPRGGERPHHLPGLKGDLGIELWPDGNAADFPVELTGGKEHRVAQFFRRQSPRAEHGVARTVSVVRSQCLAVRVNRTAAVRLRHEDPLVEPFD